MLSKNLLFLGRERTQNGSHGIDTKCLHYIDVNFVYETSERF